MLCPWLLRAGSKESYMLLGGVCYKNYKWKNPDYGRNGFAWATHMYFQHSFTCERFRKRYFFMLTFLTFCLFCSWIIVGIVKAPGWCTILLHFNFSRISCFVSLGSVFLWLKFRFPIWHEVERTRCFPGALAMAASLPCHWAQQFFPPRIAFQVAPLAAAGALAFNKPVFTGAAYSIYAYNLCTSLFLKNR